jgi:hypothetical protein
MAAVTMAAVLCTVGAAYGGNLDSPAPPTDPGSAMYTLEDIYNRLDTGTAGTQSVFAEPGAGPGSTGHTLNQVMSKAPATNANAAGAAEVLTGKTYWGIKSGEWGSQTGTMTNRGAVTLTPGTTQQAIQQGYHNGSGYVEGDADLATGNIRAGVNIFGVAGKTEVVDTTTGDAVAADLKSGKKAWVDGTEINGALATQTLAPTTVVVAAGYYAATNLAQVDTDLVAGNIATNVTIFGIAGTASTNAASAGSPAPVAKTGAGDLPSYTEVAGEDGHASMRKGVAWPNPRFTDNGNGTVTDNLTGLIWLKDANGFGTRTWANALTDCATLNSGEHGLTDGSAEGDWRLPNVQELQSLIDYGRYNPALCNAAGTGQWTSGDPFTGVQSAYYWSSTTYAGGTTIAWVVPLDVGRVGYDGKSGAHYVWPVRGGQ